MEVRQELEIDLNHLSEGLTLCIIPRKDNSIFYNDNAHENCESPYQLVEGYFYEYQFSSPNFYFCKDQIVSPNKKSKHIGLISPNTYVGTLHIPIYYKNNGVGDVELEVQSIKADYRSDYREMLLQISEICTELIMQVNSTVSHYFESNYSVESKTLFQKFEFLKSIINDEKFHLALQKILLSPVTNWTEIQGNIDIRKAKRFTSSNMKEIITNTQRIAVTDLKYLESYGISSVPRMINTTRKIDSYDTPENRFVKYILEEYIIFCIDVNSRALSSSKIYRESLRIIEELEGYTSSDFFNSITKPSLISLNSPVLQRKEGYREIFKYWLMFDLSANLVWTGAEDIYSAGKKNVALLYEYWIFFKILEILKKLFEFDKEILSNLIKVTNRGFNLHLKHGECSIVSGHYNKLLKFKFSYNRVFNGCSEYPHTGSWSVTMKPDYTLSLWPYSLNECEAERQELLSHIHFDAKYKIADLENLLNVMLQNDNVSEAEEDGIGIFKNADLLKMHAYKDGIRRSLGAYILYPGKETLKLKEFQTTLPGIGAFPVNPSGEKSETDNLEQLIIDAVKYYIEAELKISNTSIS